MGCINPKNTRPGIHRDSCQAVLPSSKLKTSSTSLHHDHPKPTSVVPLSIVPESSHSSQSNPRTSLKPNLSSTASKSLSQCEQPSSMNSTQGHRNDSKDLKDRPNSLFHLPLKWKTSFKEETPNTENSQSKVFTFESRFSNMSRVETLEKKKLENGESLLNQYRIIGLVACGTYGKVLKAVGESGELLAVKVYNKRLLKARWVSKKKTALAQVLDEIELVKTLNHPSVVKTLEIIEQPFYHKFYLVQEFMEGGSLDKKLPVQESRAQKYFKQMLQVVQTLHESFKIAHRDLKPENFLLDSKDELKITGFGSASKIGEENVLTGTYAFMPPEAFNGGKILPDKADVWALGLTLFCMIQGKLPYLSDRSSELFTEVKFGDIRVPESFTPELKELFAGIFEKDPEKRISLKDIQNSRWVAKPFV